MTPTEFRTLRSQAGLSIRKLAAQLGVQPSTVYRWESGKRATIPSGVADRLRRLAEAKSA